MVMYYPQRGSPRYYPREEIGQPDETSEVEVSPPSPPGYSPSREELQKLPKTVLLKIAIELNPDKVAMAYEEGWTKEDIIKMIGRHLSSSLGQAGSEGGDYIHDVAILESDIEED